MHRRAYSIILGILIGSAIGGWAVGVRAAVVSVAPQSAVVALDSTFVVTVQVDSEKEYINVVQGAIAYPTDTLEVISVDAGSSFLTMWISPPTVDAAAGIISFLGGKPNGTLVIDSPVLRVTFRARAVGTAAVSVNEPDTAIHLNDGFGTAASLTTVSGQYVVENDSPFTLPITSSTHAEESEWYPSVIFQAAWQPREGAFYSYTVSDQPTAIPDDIADEPADRATFESQSDGIHYFILRERLPNDDWAVVGIRRFQVDATAPLPIDTAVHQDEQSYSGKYVLSFNTYDTTSGVKLYEVVEGDALTSPATSPHVLADQSRGEDIVVRAFDRAGNAIEATVSSESPVTRARDAFNTQIILVVGMIVGIAVLVLALIALRRRSV